MSYKCPHCGESTPLDHYDGYAAVDGEMLTGTCVHCDEDFYVLLSISYMREA